MHESQRDDRILAPVTPKPFPLVPDLNTRILLAKLSQYLSREDLANRQGGCRSWGRRVRDMNQSRPLQELEVIDQGPVSSNGLSPDTAEHT